MVNLKMNSMKWPDYNGVHINAHGGAVIEYEDTYFWYGEHKTEGWEGRLTFIGVHCYSSVDLINWKDEGIVLRVSDDESSPIKKGCRIERPKVLYNDKTKKFVMWFHSTDENHTIAKSGVAVADHATGPFEFLYAKRPSAKCWPINVEDKHKNPNTIKIAKEKGEKDLVNGENDEVKQYNILGRDYDKGQMARDMNLFKDDDGAAYHIYASEHNSTLHIAKLTEDYLDHSEQYTRVFENRWMEAPAMFKKDNKYFLLMSGCTGWEPNAARGAVSDSIWGPWQELDNPCVGINPNNQLDESKTFGCQSTSVLKVKDTNQWIAMFDEWHTTNFIDSTYVWLEIDFIEDGYRIVWKDTCELISEVNKV